MGFLGNKIIFGTQPIWDNLANLEKIIISTGKYANEYYKTRIGKICNTKSLEMVQFPNLERISFMSHCGIFIFNHS